MQKKSFSPGPDAHKALQRAKQGAKAKGRLFNAQFACFNAGKIKDIIDNRQQACRPRDFAHILAAGRELGLGTGGPCP